MSTSEATPRSPPLFATTHWSVVLASQGTESPQAQEALAALCRTYWYPLYAYVRRKGHPVHDAEDLTQEFFARLVGNNLVSQFRGEGKFRSFLLASLEHFLAKEWNRAHRKKREGSHSVISLDGLDAESRYGLEPVEAVSPEVLYDHSWAMALLDQAFTRLREDYSAGGKTELFEQLKGIISGDRADARYAAIGARLGMSEEAVKVAAHRLRRHYGELVRAVVAETVSRPQELEEELRHLMAILRRSTMV